MTTTPPGYIRVPEYVCPECGRLGLMSIYRNSCTNCANVARGFYSVPTVVVVVDPIPPKEDK